jgi:hypothetical protein
VAAHDTVLLACRHARVVSVCLPCCAWQGAVVCISGAMPCPKTAHDAETHVYLPKVAMSCIHPPSSCGKASM